MSAPVTNRMMASDWKPFERNTLRGFFSLELPSGLVIHDLTLHHKGDARWIGLPGKPYVADGKVLLKDGKPTYSPVLEFVSRQTADKFRDLAIEALKELGAGE